MFSVFFSLAWVIRRTNRLVADYMRHHCLTPSSCCIVANSFQSTHARFSYGRLCLMSINALIFNVISPCILIAKRRVVLPPAWDTTACVLGHGVLLLINGHLSLHATLLRNVNSYGSRDVIVPNCRPFERNGHKSQTIKLVNLSETLSTWMSFWIKLQKWSCIQMGILHYENNSQLPDSYNTQTNQHQINSSPPGQNGCHFVCDNFRGIFGEGIVFVLRIQWILFIKELAITQL